MAVRVLRYFDVRTAGALFAQERPLANKWQRRSVIAFTLFWRLVPFAVAGALLASLADTEGLPQVGIGLVGAAMWAFILGVLLGIPGGLMKGEPFFPQYVIFVTARYATRRLH